MIMAIPIRFYTVVLKKVAIETGYPGGLARFLQEHPSVPQDEHLVGVPFMSGGELQRFVDLLKAISFDLGRGLAIGEMTHGEWEPCSGIEFRSSNTIEIFPEWHAIAVSIH
jgi:hypothetical protein